MAMRQRKDGERILYNGKPATVHLSPADGGLQMITFDSFEDTHHQLMFAHFVPWQELADCPNAPDAARGE